MMPYPEPYQSMYQKRRLGALGIEWQPSSIKYTVGLDFGPGQDIQMVPLADLERMIEPTPEFIDAMYWEPENEVISDDTDSEYNVPEENSSEGDQVSINASSSGDTECSTEDTEVERSHTDSLRRSRRKKHIAEVSGVFAFTGFFLCLHGLTITVFQVELMTSSGRRVKKRNLAECDGTISGSNRMKKSRSSRKVSKRKSSKAKTLRPQRAAARNALNMFSRITGTSSDGEENDSEDDSSDSQSVLQDSNIQSNKSYANLQNMQRQCAKEEHSSLEEFTGVAKPPALSESNSVVGNKRRLVLKFSLRDSKKHVSPEDTSFKCDNQAGPVNPSSRPQETPQEDRTNKSSMDPVSSFTDITDVALSQTYNRYDCMDRVQCGMTEDLLEPSAGDEENKNRWGEINGRTSKCSRSGDVMPRDASTELDASFDVLKENKNDVNGYVKPQSISGKFSANSLIENHGVIFSCRDEEQFGTDALQDLDGVRNKELAHPDDALKSSSSFEASLLVDHHPIADAPAAPSNGNFNMDYKDSPASDKCRDNLLEINVVDTNHSNGLKENAPLKSTKLIIKTKKRIVIDTSSPKLESVTSVEDQSSARGDLKRMEPSRVLKVPEGDEDTGRSSSLRLQHSYSDRRMSDAAHTGEMLYKAKTDSEGCDSDMEENTSAVNDDHHDLETDVPEASSDAIRRTRSIKMKATSREPNSVNPSFKVRKGHALVGISRNAEKSSMELSDQLLQGSRSTRNRRSGYIDNEPSSSTLRKSNYSVRKLSWLMLSEHEEGYRYIPQLGDEVVYLRQVMPDFS
jgi:PH-interacting protein